MRYLIVLIGLPFFAGCVTEKRVDAKFGELSAAYRIEKALPIDAVLAPEIELELRRLAEGLVTKEAAGDRDQAVSTFTDAFLSWRSGNMWGGIVGLYGLFLLGLKQMKKAKGVA